MKLPLNVFIDTNIFKAKGFNIEDECFGILKRHIDKKTINYFTHKITLAECRKHISLGVKEIASELILKNQILNKACISRQMLENTKLREAVLLSNRDIPEISSEYLEHFNQYIASIKPNTISSSCVDAEQIVDDYIDRKAPFEERKNEEFKDAIVISSIKEFFKEDECAIVTADKGFQKAFEGINNFQTFRDLKDLFSFINKGNELYECVRADKKELEEYLSEQIEKLSLPIEVEAIEYDHKGCPDGDEFDDYEIEGISIKNIDEPNILDILDNEVRLSSRCVIEISVLGEVTDYASAIWDKEEHRYINLHTTKIHDEYRICVDAHYTYHNDSDIQRFSNFRLDIDGVIQLNPGNRAQREIKDSYEDDLHDFD